jgi:hypothetical protein
VKSFFILLFAITPFLYATGQDDHLLSRLEPVPPLLELQAVAISNNIPLAGIGPLTATNVLPGDSLTALITLHQNRNRLTQWLVYFEVVSNQPPSRKPKPVVLYNSVGDKFVFPRVPVTFRIRTIGPYVNSTSRWGAPAPRDSYGRATVNGTFLALGLDDCMAALYRLDPLRQKTGATNLDLHPSDKPFPDSTVKTNQTLAASLHVTLDERRALAVGEPALMNYFGAVGETPDLEDIMWKVISFPSVWSIVKHAGISGSLAVDVHKIRPISLPQGWDFPGRSQAYTFPMSVMLNEKSAVNATFIITSPSPSLVACGGIVGFLAQNPDDDQIYLTLRVISTQRGKSAGETQRK